MADFEPPDELVEMQVKFFELDAACGELDGDELAAARAERLQLVMEKQAHPWWASVGNRFEADMALRRVAGERMRPAATA